MAPDSALVSIDFEASDITTGCSWCPQWRGHIVIVHDGVSVFREWHQPRCPVAVLWAEPTPNVLSYELFARRATTD